MLERGDVYHLGLAIAEAAGDGSVDDVARRLKGSLVAAYVAVDIHALVAGLAKAKKR